MARVTVYDKNGTAIEMEGVDARECVAMGEYTFASQEPAITAPVEVETYAAEDKSITHVEPAVLHNAKSKAGKK